MAIEIGTAIFVNVDVFHHSDGKIASARPARGSLVRSGGSLVKRIKKGDIGTVVDIVRGMSPGQWNEYAEVFFQKLRKKVPIAINELNDKINFSIME